MAFTASMVEEQAESKNAMPELLTEAPKYASSHSRC